MSTGGRYEIDPVTGERVRVEAPTRSPVRHPVEAEAAVDEREPPPAKGAGRRMRKE